MVLLTNADRIIKQFRNFDAKIVFSAEGFCWPDESLASNYPTTARGKRFLNSGGNTNESTIPFIQFCHWHFVFTFDKLNSFSGFIGYAPELYQLVTAKDVQDTDDDQLYYTHMYLDPDMRKQLNMKLDHRSTLFQNLHGALGKVK